MPVHARNKGRNGEREARLWLCAALSWDITAIQRDLGQTRDGGADLLGIPGLTIEVKRQETLNVHAWWRQVNRAADNVGNTPVLMYRQNRGKWHFCIPAGLLIPGMPGKLTLGETEFSFWLKKWVDGV
jgi:hypothetical protein